MQRFRRAGIPMPDNVPLFWTRLGLGTTYETYNSVTGQGFFVTIPVFLKEYTQMRLPMADAYLDYYITHELCHVADIYNGTQKESHGRPFHSIFVRVCPKRYWFFEEEYQPQLERRLADWGLEIPDNAYDVPRERYIRFKEQGITIHPY